MSPHTEYQNNENINIPQFDGNVSILSVSCISDTMEDLSVQNDTTCLSDLLDYTDTHQTDTSLLTDVCLIPVSVNVQFSGAPHTSPPPWYEHYNSNQTNRHPVRTTVRRDNRLLQSVQLPIIAVSNLRSLIPKVNNFVTDMHERNIGVSLLTEVWEQKSKRKHM